MHTLEVPCKGKGAPGGRAQATREERTSRSATNSVHLHTHLLTHRRAPVRCAYEKNEDVVFAVGGG